MTKEGLWLVCFLPMRYWLALLRSKYQGVSEQSFLPCRQLVEVVPGRKVRTLHGQPDTYKILTKGGDEWETPRAPYRVTLHVTARPCSVGGQGGVDEYFATAEGAPLQAVLGSGALPPGEWSRRRGACLGTGLLRRVNEHCTIAKYPITPSSDPTLIAIPSQCLRS